MKESKESEMGGGGVAWIPLVLALGCNDFQYMPKIVLYMYLPTRHDVGRVRCAMARFYIFDAQNPSNCKGRWMCAFHSNLSSKYSADVANHINILRISTIYRCVSPKMRFTKPIRTKWRLASWCLLKTSKPKTLLQPISKGVPPWWLILLQPIF